MERSKVGIIIPAYNEEATILNLINKVEKSGVPIIIDDCSSDKTQELINYQDNKVLYYKNPKNIGYEKSIQKGFEIAIKNNFDYLITYDADNQHFPEDILQIKLYLMEGNSIAIGERENFQRFSEKLFSKVFKFFFDIEDPLTGLKGYRSSLFKENDQVFDSNYLVGVELLIRALIKDRKIAKFKIKTIKRKGNPRYGNIFTGNYKILRALFYCLLLYISNKNLK